MHCDRPAENNLSRAGELIAEAASKRAAIVCLPELFLSPYFCQYKHNDVVRHSAQPIPGPATDYLGNLARHYRVCILGGSIFERGGDGRYYDTTPVIDERGQLVGIYRKTHLPEDERYHEQHYFSPGTERTGVYTLAGCRVAPLLCYDQWFPETARLAALAGAEVICFPSAIGRFTDEEPAEGDWQSAWEDVQRAHAIANNVHVVAVNRTGIEGGLAFWGGSFGSDSFGKVLARGGEEEGVVVVTCNLSQAEETRRLWGFHRNRRPDLYSPLSESLANEPRRPSKIGGHLVR
ncbi:MAG: nitrilase-related carbon-nitrogen hydrolase [Gemmataceae bacterium]